MRWQYGELTVWYLDETHPS